MSALEHEILAAQERLIERGRAEERAALAAHLKAEMVELEGTGSWTWGDGFRAALVDTLTWLEARNSE